MSLVSTWVKMADGKWYQNPTIFSKSRNWYLCFDDDDPPELVIKEDKPRSKVERLELATTILKWWNIDAKIQRSQLYCQRMFPPEYSGFYQAFSFFIKIRSAIKLEDELLGIYDSWAHEKPEGQGVYYEWNI